MTKHSPSPPRTPSPRAPLLDIFAEEWVKANAFFDDPANKDEVKFSKPVKFKQSKQRIGHSFIKVGEDIYAMSNGLYLGEGGEGKIKLLQTEAGANYAVKIGRMPITEIAIEERAEELEIMKLVDLFMGYVTRPAKDYMVMPLIPGKNLYDTLYQPLYAHTPHLAPTENQKLIISYYCCLAVKELHKKRIVHADIKPLNIMVNMQGNLIMITIIDFGIALRLPPGVDSIIDYPKGSYTYQATETTSPPARYSFASDVSSLGKVLEHDLDQPEEIWEGTLDDSPKNRPPLDLVIKRIEKRMQFLKIHL